MSDLTITALSFNALNSLGIISTVDGAPITSGMVVPHGKTLVCKAPTGKQFFNTIVSGAERSSIYINSKNSGGGNSKDNSFILTENKTIASFTVGDPPTGNTWGRIYATLQDYREFDYVFTQADIDNLTSSKAVLKVDGVTVEVGKGIKYGQTLVANCASNREFQMINISYFTVSSIYFEGKNTGGQSRYIGFELSNDNKTATTVFSPPDSAPLYWSALKSITNEVTEVVGNNSVYLIDDDILTSVISERFSPTGETALDYGVFILSLIDLPFKIPESIILESEQISLGNKKLNVSAPLISNDNISFDLGSITVPRNEDNFLDFANTIAVIHLPRTPPINLNIDYVIGETVSIEYVVDCYTGIAQINLRSSKIDDVFFTSNVDIGVNVPYISTAGTTRLENSSVKVGGENGVKNPYIEILRKDATLKNGFFTVPIIDEGFLNGYNGYARVEGIKLASKATSYEKGLILSQLVNGVIIN